MHIANSLVLAALTSLVYGSLKCSDIEFSDKKEVLEWTKNATTGQFSNLTLATVPGTDFNPDTCTQGYTGRVRVNVELCDSEQDEGLIASFKVIVRDTAVSNIAADTAVVARKNNAYFAGAYCFDHRFTVFEPATYAGLVELELVPATDDEDVAFSNLPSCIKVTTEQLESACLSNLSVCSEFTNADFRKTIDVPSVSFADANLFLSKEPVHVSPSSLTRAEYNCAQDKDLVVSVYARSFNFLPVRAQIIAFDSLVDPPLPHILTCETGNTELVDTDCFKIVDCVVPPKFLGATLKLINASGFDHNLVEIKVFATC